MTSEKTREFVESLLRWSKKNMRSFPWRRTNEPYQILIAEVMLQRTRADQVLPIFRNFIKRYPNPKAITQSSLEEIQSSIWPLGLAKRAYGLKRLAEQLTSEYNGNVPKSKKELIALYGVGNYIANAVLCHAYGESVPTVDSNFARVLKRVFSLEVGKPAQKDRTIWSFARDLMPIAGGRFRVLNLAVIDLASLVCTHRNPRCPECPVNRICDYVKKTRWSKSSISEPRKRL